MLSSVEGKETLVRRLFNANAALPTDVTPSGTVKEVSALQLANASPPMETVLAGRSTAVSSSQSVSYTHLTLPTKLEV